MTRGNYAMAGIGRCSEKSDNMLLLKEVFLFKGLLLLEWVFCKDVIPSAAKP
jgi:hypothetical protein